MLPDGWKIGKRLAMAVIAFAIAACGTSGTLEPVDPEDRVVAGMFLLGRISGEPLPVEVLADVTMMTAASPRAAVPGRAV